MNKKKKLLNVLVAVMICVFVFSACSTTTDTSETEAAAAESTEPAETVAEETTSSAESAGGGSSAQQIADEFGITPLEFVEDDAVFAISDTESPDGSPVVGVSDLLSLFQSGDKEKIQDMGLTACICMHQTASDFSQSMLEGFKAVFEEFNITVLSESDAEWKVDQSISDLEQAIARQPDIIIHLVIDGTASLPLIQEAAAQGIVVGLVDTVPEGIQPEDYASTTIADGYANGYYTAKYLAEEWMGGEGEVALINFVQDLYATNTRTWGAEAAFAEYPNITIVEEPQHDGTNENCAAIAEGLVNKYPDLDAIWTVWDMPGMAAVGVVENAGKADQIKVATIDLSEDIGYDLASGGACICIGAQHPYDQGVSTALAAIADVLGYDPPKNIVVPGELVVKGTEESFAASWERIFHKELPAEFDGLWD